jgi:Rab-like protein 5
MANVLSESASEQLHGGDYRPTQGCRILEFEVPDVIVSGKTVKAEVELWDCSGDHKFETCWPAVAKDSSGVILVFNPDDSSQVRDLESWYRYYVDQQGLRDTQCIIFAHSKQASSEHQTPSLPSKLAKLTCVNTSLEDDGDLLKREFTGYLGNLLKVISERREQDELTILDNR